MSSSSVKWPPGFKPGSALTYTFPASSTTCCFAAFVALAVDFFFFFEGFLFVGRGGSPRPLFFLLGEDLVPTMMGVATCKLRKCRKSTVAKCESVAKALLRSANSRRRVLLEQLARLNWLVEEVPRKTFVVRSSVTIDSDQKILILNLLYCVKNY